MNRLLSFALALLALVRARAVRMATAIGARIINNGGDDVNGNNKN
jgi:hypothetical protein